MVNDLKVRTFTCAAAAALAGRKVGSMYGNSLRAFSTLYDAGVTFDRASRCLSALRPCQKQSWCLACGQTTRNALISEKSLSIKEYSGNTPRCLSASRNRSRTILLAPEATPGLVLIRRYASGVPEPSTPATAPKSSKLPPFVFPDNHQLRIAINLVMQLTRRVHSELLRMSRPVLHEIYDGERDDFRLRLRRDVQQRNMMCCGVRKTGR